MNADALMKSAFSIIEEYHPSAYLLLQSQEKLHKVQNFKRFGVFSLASALVMLEAGKEKGHCVRKSRLEGSYKGANSNRLRHRFLAVLKTETLIYQCFYFAKTAKNAILGILMLRSCLFKQEMKIFVDNIPTFVYIYFHEGGFISAIAH